MSNVLSVAAVEISGRTGKIRMNRRVHLRWRLRLSADVKAKRSKAKTSRRRP